MESVVEICKKVLMRLSEMDYEINGGSSKQRLIFPNKFPTEKDGKTFTHEELLNYTRISEQELRFLFFEEFLKDKHNEFYYSVETPTKYKYRFGKSIEDIEIDTRGRSASIDMSVFIRDIECKYKRILNIEFKYANASKKSISKDILKLMHEEENGAFVLLLKNTDAGTLKSVFEKISTALEKHKQSDNNFINKSYIEIIILSLEVKKNNKGKPFLFHRKIIFDNDYKEVFPLDLVNVEKLNRIGWNIEYLDVLVAD
jgi:hypothetical protein